MILRYIILLLLYYYYILLMSFSVGWASSPLEDWMGRWVIMLILQEIGTPYLDGKTRFNA